MSNYSRQRAYGCHITYGTGSEFGFDYLRDHLVDQWEQRVQRGQVYAIIDEVDSILIDEARTPLIIAEEVQHHTDYQRTADRVVRELQENLHYEVDQRQKNIVLTDRGFKTCEEKLGIDILASVKHMELYHAILQALKAHALFKRDEDYVVIVGEAGPRVAVVDPYTGRPMDRRRYTNGLRQAIEVKEGLPILGESRVNATISFQNYFRKYRKLAGMSGTLMTEAQEFAEIYGVETVAIPTNRPILRRDYEDWVFLTEREKWNAVIEDVRQTHQLGRPVLIGTLNIRKSEEVSSLLTEAGIPHVLLNAKTLEQEADIIAGAGEPGVVTVATNMAGRGTDIKLGYGAPALGGLHVVGTGRHEARRIDDQLRGRAGRQGDLGSSCFYCSLEDELMQKHGPQQLNESPPREIVLSERKRLRLVEKAQRRVEMHNFNLRKNLLEFDDVMNQQRELLYSWRDDLLCGMDCQEAICQMIHHNVLRLVVYHTPVDLEPKQWDGVGLMLALHRLFRQARQFRLTGLPGLTREELITMLANQALEIYGELERVTGADQLRQRERQVLLKNLDRRWAEHLEDMEQLRRGITLQTYGQKHPIHAYIREGRELFATMQDAIRYDTVADLFTLKR